MYLEQCFVTKNSKTNEEFISAIALIKWVPVKVDVTQMMKSEFDIDKILLDPQVTERILIINEEGVKYLF